MVFVIERLSYMLESVIEGISFEKQSAENDEMGKLSRHALQEKPQNFFYFIK